MPTALRRRLVRYARWTAILGTLRVPTAGAAEPESLEEETETVTVTTAPEDDRTGGSQASFDEATLQQVRPLSGNQILRTLPGMHVADEDGFGLRPNLSIRGLDGDRGRTVTVLEDGVPITMAPYGQPETYYFPPIDRIAGAVLLKGPDQVRFGPQTIGGVLDLRTPDPPEELEGTATLRYGSYGYLYAGGSVGGSTGPAGFLLHAMHLRFTGPRQLQARQTDVSGKFVLRTGPRARLMFKVNIHDQQSHATHLGLTQPQFDRDPTMNLAQNDRFPIRRYATSVHHTSSPHPSVRWDNVVYAHALSRSWDRQDFQRSVTHPEGLDPNGRPWSSLYDAEGRAVSSLDDLPAADLADGSAVLFQQTNGLRDLNFRVVGASSRVRWSWHRNRNVQGQLEGALSGHYEDIRGRYLIGDHPLARTGTVRNDGLQVGKAVSGLVWHRLDLFERVHLTTTLRTEALWQQRETYLSRVDGVPTPHDPAITGEAFTPGLLPAFAFSVDATPQVAVYGGVHRGWQPPRTTDVVTTEGLNLGLGPRSSWNSELGVRGRHRNQLFVEATGFLMDFDRQIIAPSESAGIVATDPGNAIVGGKARYAGGEISARWDLGATFQQDFQLPIDVSYTFVPLADFGDDWTPDRQGNRVPYAPPHLFNARLSLHHPVGALASLTVHHIGTQLADFENTLNPSRDGLRGRIPAFTTLDATVGWQFPRAGWELFVAGHNLTNQVYIASRRPRGIQPAGFLTVIGGVSGRFGARKATQRSDGDGPTLQDPMIEGL